MAPEVPKPFQALQCLVGLLRENHELPAAVVWSTRNNSGGSCWIANLVVLGQISRHDSWGGVDNNPVVVEVKVCQFITDGAANEAVCSICTNCVFSADGAYLAAFEGNGSEAFNADLVVGKLDAIFILFEVINFVTLPSFDVGK